LEVKVSEKKKRVGGGGKLITTRAVCRKRAKREVRRNSPTPRKGTPGAATLDTARTAYIQLLGSLGSNAEVRAEVTRFREQLDQMQLQMLSAPKARERPTQSSASKDLFSKPHHLKRVG
jgi:hypothetical protein